MAGSRDSEENIDKRKVIDRQLAGQSSSTPFINTQEENNKRVIFNIKDSIEQKINKPTVEAWYSLEQYIGL